jgi:uncharacterized phage-associated protein
MRIDPDTCRDPDLLAAEVRRLRCVIDAGEMERLSQKCDCPAQDNAARQDKDDIAILRADNNRRADLEVGLREGVEKLQAEVRRLEEVIAASQPTLTDEEREAIAQAAMRVECLCQRGAKDMAATLRGLEFPFDLEKAIQAIGVLHSVENDDKVPYYRLLKLLYISDREYLKETGRPIVGGREVAVNRGPLSSPVYDLIKGEHSQANRFAEFFSKQNRLLVMHHQPSRDELSKREIRKLTEISEKYREAEDDDIGQLTHDFPEYAENFVRDTSTAIPLSAKLRALGMADMQKAIEADIESMLAWKRSAASNPGATMTNEVDEVSAASRGSHVVGRTVTEEDMSKKPVAKLSKLLHETRYDARKLGSKLG